MNLDEKVFLFYDAQGSYVHMAQAVVGQVKQVKYFCPWQKAFSVPMDMMPGIGLEGIDRVVDFWDELDSVDLVVFTDVGNGGMQEYIRGQGIPVFGSGAAGEIEMNRAKLKSVCQQSGIDVADYMPIRGIDNLREMLSTDEECYVKVSYWRGLCETFHHTSPFATKAWLDDISLRAGPYGQMIDFILEKPIAGDPCVEIGFDTFTADGMYPDLMAFGYEAKDAAFALSTGAIPPRLWEIARKLQPMLKNYSYRGPISIESRVTEQGDYFVDLTARFPEPPSSLQRFMIVNWAEIMWEGANGRIVEPDYIAKIGVELVLKSAWGAEHPLAVQIARPDRVTLHGHCVIEGQDFSSSPAELEEFGAACGMGSTLEEAMADAIDAAEGVKGFQVNYEASALEELTEVIGKGIKLDLPWQG